MRIFIDIDGTLTTDGNHAWGPVRPRALERVRELMAAGHEVFLWSARGEQYAFDFARKNRLLAGAQFLGKPDIYVDDHKEIRAASHMRHVDPDTFENASSLAAMFAGDDG